MVAAGLYAIGATWSPGNDIDVWAYCMPYIKVERVKRSEEQNDLWYATQKFTTQPMKRCQTGSIENPLLEPVKTGGSYVKYTKQALFDRNDDPLVTSSLEPIEGAVRDKNHATVWVEINSASNMLSTFDDMMDTVNDATLWGLPERCVKLSNVTWERNFYAVCTAYYTTRYEFDVDKTTFDETFPDKGTRVLQAGGDPDDPNDFELFKLKGENTWTYLDGSGNSVTDINSAATIDAEYYDESNFLSIPNLPSSL
jgi:hypothetical protein